MMEKIFEFLICTLVGSLIGAAFVYGALDAEPLWRGL